MDSITITREEFQKLSGDLLKKELNQVADFTGGNDVMLQVAITGLAAKCFKNLECKLFKDAE